mmetsp:Transcript_2417/g.9355  ORF Transcript_2417/g.9355 Transcript_2417/m.9355 type:complete len:365 (-) Transcript_2417:502-1596(-)
MRRQRLLPRLPLDRRHPPGRRLRFLEERGRADLLGERAGQLADEQGILRIGKVCVVELVPRLWPPSQCPVDVTGHLEAVVVQTDAQQTHRALELVDAPSFPRASDRSYQTRRAPVSDEPPPREIAFVVVAGALRGTRRLQRGAREHHLVVPRQQRGRPALPHVRRPRRLAAVGCVIARSRVVDAAKGAEPPKRLHGFSPRGRHVGEGVRQQGSVALARVPHGRCPEVEVHRLVDAEGHGGEVSEAGLRPSNVPKRHPHGRAVPKVGHRAPAVLVRGEVDAARDDVAGDPRLAVGLARHVPLANPVPVESVRVLRVAHAVLLRERASRGGPADLHYARGAYGDLVLPPAAEDAGVGAKAAKVGAG